MDTLKGFITAATQWWKRKRIARALTRFSAGMGKPLSGGIALTGLLSIAAALTIALTAMVGVFRRHPDFKDVVFSQINDVLPGIIDMGNGGMLAPDDLVFNAGWNIAGIIAVLVLLNTATGVMKALRTSLRSMFGLHNAAENPVIGKLRDLGAFVGLALSVLVTSLLSVGARAAYEWLHATVGHWGIIPDSQLTLQLITVGIGLLVDAGVFMFLFRALAGARVPWPQLWRGALLGGIATGALRYLGASVVANVGGNPLLASVATVATLLLWLNIAARVTLIVAAWTADPPARPKITKDLVQHADHTPNYVSVAAPETLEWDYGVYSGNVQPLPQEEPEYSATWAAVEARRNRKSLSERIEQLKQHFAEVNRPQPGELGPGEWAGAHVGPDGPPPLIRVAPESPAGKLKHRIAERSRS